MVVDKVNNAPVHRHERHFRVGKRLAVACRMDIDTRRLARTVGRLVRLYIYVKAFELRAHVERCHAEMPLRLVEVGRVEIILGRTGTYRIRRERHVHDGNVVFLDGHLDDRSGRVNMAYFLRKQPLALHREQVASLGQLALHEDLRRVSHLVLGFVGCHGDFAVAVAVVPVPVRAGHIELAFRDDLAPAAVRAGHAHNIGTTLRRLYGELLCRGGAGKGNLFLVLAHHLALIAGVYLPVPRNLLHLLPLLAQKLHLHLFLGRQVSCERGGAVGGNAHVVERHLVPLLGEARVTRAPKADVVLCGMHHRRCGRGDKLVAAVGNARLHTVAVGCAENLFSPRLLRNACPPFIIERAVARIEVGTPVIALLGTEAEVFKSGVGKGEIRFLAAPACLVAAACKASAAKIVRLKVSGNIVSRVIGNGGH